MNNSSSGPVTLLSAQFYDKLFGAQWQWEMIKLDKHFKWVASSTAAGKTACKGWAQTVMKWL